MIRLKEINKFFGSLHVLKDIHLHVKEGEKITIIGPSGSGKSTLIRIISGIEEPTSGEVYLNGERLVCKKCAVMVRMYCIIVFRQFNLYPQMTVLQNITLVPTKLQKKSRPEAEEIAFHYLDAAGLKHKAGSYPGTLSALEQHRIAIARALATGQKMLLFDESASAPDPWMMKEALDMINRLRGESVTVVAAARELGFARQAADRLIFMDKGAFIGGGEK